MHLHAIISHHVYTVDTQKRYYMDKIQKILKNQRHDIMQYYTDNFQIFKHVDNVHKQTYINDNTMTIS